MAGRTRLIRRSMLRKNYMTLKKRQHLPDGVRADQAVADHIMDTLFADDERITSIVVRS
jgi:hypothetical protein